MLGDMQNMNNFMSAAIQIDGTYKILAVVGAILLVAAPRLMPMLAKLGASGNAPVPTPTPIAPYLLDNEWLAAYQHLMSDAMRAGCADSVGLLNDLMECRTTRGLDDEKGGA